MLLLLGLYSQLNLDSQPYTPALVEMECTSLCLPTMQHSCLSAASPGSQAEAAVSGFSGSVPA